VREAQRRYWPDGCRRGFLAGLRPRRRVCPTFSPPLKTIQTVGMLPEFAVLTGEIWIFLKSVLRLVDLQIGLRTPVAIFINDPGQTIAGKGATPWRPRSRTSTSTSLLEGTS